MRTRCRPAIPTIPDPYATVTGHADVTGADIVLISKKAVMSGVIHANTLSGNPVPGVVITATTTQVPPSGKTLTVTTDANGAYAFDDGTGTGHARKLEPVLWNFNYNVADFNRSASRSRSPPAAPSSMTSSSPNRKAASSGRRSPKFGTAAAVAEGGVTVSAQKNGNPGNPVFQTTSSSLAGHIGEYTIGGLVNGQYTVTFHKTGYADVTTPAAITAVGGVQHRRHDHCEPSGDNHHGEVGRNRRSGRAHLHPRLSRHADAQASPAQRSNVTYTFPATNSAGVTTLAQVLPSTYTISITARTDTSRAHWT